MNTSFSGHYKFVITNINGQQRETEWFDNLITDTGLDMLGYQGSNCCWVGDGSVEPAFSDTTLSGSIVASTASSTQASSTQLQETTLPYYAYGTDTFTFAVSAIVGTIKEVGIGYASNTTTRPVTSLFSRALINNGTGITLVSGDQLQVIYQLRMYVPQNEATFTLDINGIERQCTVRPYMARYEWYVSVKSYFYFYTSTAYTNVFAYTGTMTTDIFNGSVSGSQIRASSITNISYVTGSREKLFSFRWLPAKGTFTTTVFSISATNFYLGPGFQISVSPGIEKTNMQTMDISGKYTWGRYS